MFVLRWQIMRLFHGARAHCHTVTHVHFQAVKTILWWSLIYCFTCSDYHYLLLSILYLYTLHFTVYTTLYLLHNIIITPPCQKSSVLVLFFNVGLFIVALERLSTRKFLNFIFLSVQNIYLICSSLDCHWNYLYQQINHCSPQCRPSWLCDHLPLFLHH